LVIESTECLKLITTNSHDIPQQVKLSTNNYSTPTPFQFVLSSVVVALCIVVGLFIAKEPCLPHYCLAMDVSLHWCQETELKPVLQVTGSI
jgi:hypothetical protein